MNNCRNILVHRTNCLHNQPTAPLQVVKTSSHVQSSSINQKCITRVLLRDLNVSSVVTSTLKTGVNIVDVA